jgi:integrase
VTPQRKLIQEYGARREPDRVRVFRETVGGESVVRVQWMEYRRRVTRSFEDSRQGIAEAKAFAQATRRRLSSPPTVSYPEITVRDLFERYITAKQDAWRPATLLGVRVRWRQFELHVDRHTPARAITREHLDELKRSLLALRPRGGDRARSVNQIKLTIKNACGVFRWGVDRDLIPPTKVVTYRPEFGRDLSRQVETMREFSAEERGRVLAAMDPRDPRRWRPWVLSTLFAYCGPRQSAARAIEWSDVDFAAGRIRWRAETDKLGRERYQPLPAPVVEALWVAYGWRIACGYSGRFVFFRPGAGSRDGTAGYETARGRARAARKPDRPWTYAAYIGQLHAAEKRAGLDPALFRGAHAFRRGIAGDVHAATGSEKAAADWIGDKSLTTVRDSYLLEREEEMRKTATLVGASPVEPATKCNEPDCESEGEGVKP